MSDTDLELLARYARQHSSRRNPMEADAEDAFAEIVRRHLNLVYSAALRIDPNGQPYEGTSHIIVRLLLEKSDGEWRFAGRDKWPN